MASLVSSLKKTAMAGLAASIVATGFTAVSVTSAEAQWRPRGAYGHGYRAHRPARGAAVAAGIIGGLAAGALIAGAARPAYAAPAYGGYGYAAPVYGGHGYGNVPSYYQPAYEPAYGYQPAYQPTCYVRRVRQVVDEDTVVIRRVRVCN